MSSYLANTTLAQLFKGTLPAGQFAFHTDLETNPHAIIDLGEKRTLLGILIRNREGFPSRKTGTEVSLSLDGKTWEPIWKASDLADTWEIPVTSFVAGAHVPGKEGRYIKIERHLDTPDALHLQSVKVYGR